MMAYIDGLYRNLLGTWLQFLLTAGVFVGASASCRTPTIGQQLHEVGIAEFSGFLKPAQNSQVLQVDAYSIVPGGREVALFSTMDGDHSGITLIGHIRFHVPNTDNEAQGIVFQPLRFALQENSQWTPERLQDGTVVPHSGRAIAGEWVQLAGRKSDSKRGAICAILGEGERVARWLLCDGQGNVSQLNIPLPDPEYFVPMAADQMIRGGVCGWREPDGSDRLCAILQQHTEDAVERVLACWTGTRWQYERILNFSAETEAERRIRLQGLEVENTELRLLNVGDQAIPVISIWEGTWGPGRILAVQVPRDPSLDPEIVHWLQISPTDGTVPVLLAPLASESTECAKAWVLVSEKEGYPNRLCPGDNEDEVINVFELDAQEMTVVKLEIDRKALIGNTHQKPAERKGAKIFWRGDIRCIAPVSVGAGESVRGLLVQSETFGSTHLGLIWQSGDGHRVQRAYQTKYNGQFLANRMCVQNLEQGAFLVAPNSHYGSSWTRAEEGYPVMTILLGANGEILSDSQWSGKELVTESVRVQEMK